MIIQDLTPILLSRPDLDSRPRARIGGGALARPGRGAVSQRQCVACGAGLPAAAPARRPGGGTAWAGWGSGQPCATWPLAAWLRN